MLGKLFTRSTSSSGLTGITQSTTATSKPVLTLESVQEDMHTRSLLFPDPQTLAQTRNDQLFPMPLPPPTTNQLPPFDCIPEICLEERDVRILIMQDSVKSLTSSVLYDTHPAPPSPPAQQPTCEAWRSSASSRRSSVPHAPSFSSVRGSGSDLPNSRSGAFDRRSSTTGRFPLNSETDSQRAGREYREEINTLLGCTFGNSELLSYKGTSTKVHLIPSDSRSCDFGSSSLVGDGRNSIGRSSLRSSRLAQSYSSEVFSPGFPPNLSYTTSASSSMSTRSVDNKRVIITRMFPVAPPVSEDPPTSPDAQEGPRRPSRMTRVPMYAVVLVINLQALSGLAARPNFKGSGSFTEHDSLPSSYGSGRKMMWQGAGSAIAEPVEFAYPESDERLEHITQHWDIIMRALTSLQSVATSRITEQLKQQETEANAPAVSTPPISGHRQYPPSLVKSTTKWLFLPVSSLVKDDMLSAELPRVRERIITGLQAERVVTGQGRWSVWRDEARTFARMNIKDGVSSKEFLHQALTGFLGSHSNWIQALGPDSYRQRRLDRDILLQDEDLVIPSRTVVISQDKMSARRMVFLLSAFFPASTQDGISIFGGLGRARIPSSTSLNLSGSPPAFAIPGREQCLRKKVGRKPEPKKKMPVHRRTPSQNTRVALAPTGIGIFNYSVNGPPSATGEPATPGVPGSQAGDSPALDPSRTPATASAAVPEPAIAHITSLQWNEKFRAQRPGSSSSVAADDLKRSLKRSESMSMGSDTTAGSRWGSIMSGLWGGTPNTRRESLTSVTQSHMSSPVRGGVASREPMSPRRSPDKRGVRADPVANLGFSSEELSSAVSKAEPQPADMTESDGGALQSAPDIQPRQPIDVPKDNLFGSPIKSTVNPNDGIIDIDIPMSDFVTSFETAVSSPCSSGYMSIPGHTIDPITMFEQAARLWGDVDRPVNVAGWLRTYHPDFALQSVPPSDDLVTKIKEALRGERTPGISQDHEGWVLVSEATMIDIGKAVVSRIRYSRFFPERDNDGTRPIGPSGNQWTNERFAISTIDIVEDALAEAVDRVIAMPGEIVKTSSNPRAVPVPGAKETGGSDTLQVSRPMILSSSMPPVSSLDPNLLDKSSLRNSAPRDVPSPLFQKVARERILGNGEVPRGECRAVLLGSLKSIIKQVQKERERRGDPSFLEEEGGAVREAVSRWLAEGSL